MKQDGYLFLLVLTTTSAILIISFTFLDVVRTRQQRILADSLLAKAKDEFIHAETTNASKKSDVDEMQILHDIVLENESPSKRSRLAGTRQSQRDYG